MLYLGRGNLLSALKSMRAERGAMIQSFEQCKFTFRAITQMAVKLGLVKPTVPAAGVWMVEGGWCRPVMVRENNLSLGILEGGVYCQDATPATAAAARLTAAAAATTSAAYLGPQQPGGNYG
jgi:hypothetical protein